MPMLRTLFEQFIEELSAMPSVSHQRYGYRLAVDGVQATLHLQAQLVFEQFA